MTEPHPMGVGAWAGGVPVRWSDGSTPTLAFNAVSYSP